MPKAGRTRIEGIVVDAGGGAQLKVSVTAVPKKGKANKALLKLLSKEWGVGIRGLRLITGAAGFTSSSVTVLFSSIDIIVL